MIALLVEGVKNPVIRAKAAKNKNYKSMISIIFFAPVSL